MAMQLISSSMELLQVPMAYNLKVGMVVGLIVFRLQGVEWTHRNSYLQQVLHTTDADEPME